LIVAQEKEHGARLRLAAVFALVVFQLQHHESLFWAGSSIDHFLVVLAAVAALGALASRSRWSLVLACVSGFVATFSLAHGILVWPIGAAMLWLERRWRDGGIWAAAGAGSIALFFLGFQFNPGHRLPSLGEVPGVFEYWLTLAGSSPALGNVTLAPWLGAVLIGATIFIAWQREPGRERLSCAIIAWCLSAMAMIAWGRAFLASEYAPITSRYVILSSIAWALLVWLLVERELRRNVRRNWWLGPVLGALVVFNVSANAAHRATGRWFAQHGERAVQAYQRYGSFAQAENPPYPDLPRADALIRQAEERGIFHLPKNIDPKLCDPDPVQLVDAVEVDDITYFIEEVAEAGSEIRIRGWAFRRDETTTFGNIAVVFRSPTSLLAVEATPCARPDVAEVQHRWDATYSGFELRIARDQLPEGEFGIGICFDLGDSPEYMMTSHKVGGAHARAE
jgi:hypothetical protein